MMKNEQNRQRPVRSWLVALLSLLFTYLFFIEYLKPEGICGLHRTSDVVPRDAEMIVPAAKTSASGDRDS